MEKKKANTKKIKSKYKGRRYGRHRTPELSLLKKRALKAIRIKRFEKK